jgi:hypothetical protein
LNPGTSYTFTATPYDADGNPGETKQTSISTAKPAAPTVSIAKSGTAPSDPTAQIIVSCTVSNGTATVNYTGGTAQTVTADGSAHDYTFTGLTPNTKYTFTVTSTDSYSQTSTATTDITTDQAVAVVLPVVTSFTGKATSTQNITLTVVADANTSYVIIKCTSHPNDVLDVTNTTNGSTSKFDRSYVGLSAGTPYTFTATPYTSGNVAGTTTGTLTVTTSATTIPAKPTVTISKKSTTSVQIVVTCTVSNGTATVNYTGGTAQTVTADGSAHDYTFSDLSPDTSYTFTITSTDSYGQSASANVSISTAAAAAAAAPAAKFLTATISNYAISNSNYNIALTATSVNMTKFTTKLHNTYNGIIESLPGSFISTTSSYTAGSFADLSNLVNVLLKIQVGANVPYRSITIVPIYAVLTPYNSDNIAGVPFTTNTIRYRVNNMSGVSYVDAYLG